MGQLEDMQVFVRVVEAGGIGLAAEQMGLAKSAVSRRLSDLESKLGVTLITRTTRTSSLTDTGHLYYKRAVTIIDDISELNAQASDPRNSLSGTLRLAAPLSFGLLHLSDALDSFTKLHPELTLHIDFSDYHIDLVEGGYDLAFRIGHLKDSTLKARPISPIHHIICASPDYLQQWGCPQKPKDLMQHKLLRYTLNGKNLWKFTEGQGKEISIPSAAKIQANNGDFLVKMAIAGHGLLMTPTFIAWKALQKGQLKQVLTDFPLESSAAYAVYPQTRYLSRRARLLIDHLAKTFGDVPYWDEAL